MNTFFRLRLCGSFLAILLSFTMTHIGHANDPFAPQNLVDRWDLTVTGADGSTYPSWLEIRLSGNATLVGSYVGQFGSARPISKVERTLNDFRFVVPPQWEKSDHDFVFEGSVDGDKMHGHTTDEQGHKISWQGVRAPRLDREGPGVPQQSIELFNGTDLSGWKPMFDNVPNGWIVRNGALRNDKPGNNLMTDATFEDFQLHVEFRYPEHSNSGIYLRGRYEVQIEDNYGDDPESHKIGGVYGFLTPSINAGKSAGEWQTYDITLRGRVITVVLNGERVIDRQIIPGITGGAINSDEGSAGPLYIQGDHGPVEFRKITLTPLK
ncbi:MAG: DUF1080 domain-containing protein [Planctomycetales bacterium]|nr:DUF1080 domain-containing protein [Planctomycetales bacterium]